MRVLSGKYKNRKLKSPNNQKVRPTSSVVKKSLFDIIRNFDNKKVLDLFAGTGSLGLESISRGAKNVVFVEKDRVAINILFNNLKNICPEENCLVIKQDVESFIKNERQIYDIIFADPPYGLYEFQELKDKVCKLLKYGGIFCMEKAFDNKDYDEDVRVKKYGETQILIWEKNRK